MAQTKFRANLSAATFPLVSDFMGRTVIVGQYDQNYLHKQRLSGEDSDQDIGLPQIYYGHNIMPTGQGFKSITYNVFIRPVLGGVTTFSKIIQVKDPSENKGFISITSDSRLFIYVTGSSSWTEITAATGGWTGAAVDTSFAYANGYTYLCLSLHDVYVVSITGRTIASAVLAGITNSLVVGVTSAANYLILYDTIQVYWSSSVDTNDFVPSLTTGAGSGVPTDLNGQIVACLPFNNGFAIYSTQNIVLASFSGNVRFPWIFKCAPNSSGIMSSEHVTYDGDQGTSYAWTSAGLLKVSPASCTPVNPEITDFLAGRIFEDYDSATHTFTEQYLTTQLKIKLTYAASRYLVISYGITDALTHAIVYDTALKRIGKLKINHVDCIELGQDSDADLPWKSILANAWNYFTTIRWSELRTLSNEAAQPKRTIGFLQADGTVEVMVWDFGDYTSDAVLILGRYQLTRSRLCTLQGYDVENVDTANSNFTTRVSTTIDGKTDLPTLTTPALVVDGPKIKTYAARVTGKNHSLIFQGAFNLASVELAISPNGRR